MLNKTFKIKTHLIGPEKTDKKDLKVLNRIIRYTESGIELEADLRHAELIIKQLGLENAKELSNPSAEEVKREDDEVELNAHYTTQYKSIVARANYLASDRPDIQFAVKKLATSMSKPNNANWHELKRLGRYIKGKPRAIQIFKSSRLGDNNGILNAFSDSDWAGCRRSGKSTSGGCIMRGAHFLKGWSRTQQCITLSSAEAELYALLKGASQSLGLRAMAHDFGDDPTTGLYSDASAAIAISQRVGLGKLRRIQTQYLWLQERVFANELELNKLVGTAIPADMLTKKIGQSRPRQASRIQWSSNPRWARGRPIAC